MNNTDYSQDAMEYIDISMIIRGYLRFFRRFWFLPIIFCVILCPAALGVNFYLQKTSTSYYTAQATYTVEKGSDTEDNATFASRLATGIPTITSTSDFHSAMNEALGQQIWGYYISAEATSSANLFTVYVTFYDPDMANDLLEAFDDVYPSWAVDLIGSCSIIRVDQTLSSPAEESSWFSKKMLLLGVAGAFCLWICIATAYLLLVHKVHGESDMAALTLSPYLGSLPEIRKKKRDKSTRESLLITETHIDRDYRQSLRSLRWRIEKLIREGGRTFLLTSTTNNEGRSLITLNLAYALRDHDKKVTVIDADFYDTGILSTLQKEDRADTLYDYLTNGDIEQLLPTDVNGISVIFAKHKNSSDKAGDPEHSKEASADYLNVARFRTLIDELKKTSDVILIDTPPTQLRGDALIFSGAVDSVLYVVRCDHSNCSDIDIGMEPFYRNGKLGGYILNRIKAAESHYGKYYQYGYGYGSHYGSYSHYASDDKEDKKKDKK